MKCVIVLIWIYIPFCVFTQSTADNYYKKAKVFDSLGNMEKAVEYYTKTINQDSTYLNAYFNKGTILTQQQDYHEALETFKIFNTQSPDDNEVLYLMATCYYYLNNNEKSFELVNKSLKINDDFFDAHKLRGFLYSIKGEYDKAIVDFDQALLLRDAADIFYLKGICYEKLGLNDRALNQYFLSEKNGYINDALFNNIGNLLNNQNDKLKAIVYFDKAIKINPNVSIYYYNKGVATFDLGLKDQAINCWKKAKKLGYNSFSDEILKLIN